MLLTNEDRFGNQYSALYAIKMNTSQYNRIVEITGDDENIAKERLYLYNQYKNIMSLFYNEFWQYINNEWQCPDDDNNMELYYQEISLYLSNKNIPKEFHDLIFYFSDDTYYPKFSIVKIKSNIK